MRFIALSCPLPQGMVQGMKRDGFRSKQFSGWLGALLLAAACGRAAGEASAADTAAFDKYVSAVEARLELQHRSRVAFLSGLTPENEAQARRGEVAVERIATPGVALQGAMLHHWRGTAFAPGAKAADFERVMRDFAAYPRLYAPEVVSARVVAASGDRLQAAMRVKQKHVLTVVMDTAYDVTFGRLDATRGWSLSRSTHIAEIDAAGTPKERALGPSEEHGFLWRLNTYWTYEERDGGLYLQVESISLTRAVPRGLGWAVGPYVESIPRESLEFTLRGTCAALKSR